jgi:indole-3-glycerol phosphate synthase
VNILDQIVAHKKEEVAASKAEVPLAALMESASLASPARPFRRALLDPARPAPRLIAEIKRRSPSRGDLLPGLDPAGLAALYERHGAAAVSVLADGRFFGGSVHDLAAARRSTLLPVLCKEFVIDPYQVYAARAAGADAVLLIAAILDAPRLRDFIALCSTLGMAALVEVHDRAELDAALRAGADITGINNRDLRTFTVSLETTAALVPLVPAGVVVVSESGVRGSRDRQYLRDLGVDAVLVGESLVSAADIAEAVEEMSGGSPAAMEGAGRGAATR